MYHRQHTTRHDATTTTSARISRLLQRLYCTTSHHYPPAGRRVAMGSGMISYIHMFTYVCISRARASTGIEGKFQKTINNYIGNGQKRGTRGAILTIFWTPIWDPKWGIGRGYPYFGGFGGVKGVSKKGSKIVTFYGHLERIKTCQNRCQKRVVFWTQIGTRF